MCVYAHVSALVLCPRLAYSNVDNAGGLAEAASFIVTNKVGHQEVKDVHSDGRGETAQLELCGGRETCFKMTVVTGLRVLFKCDGLTLRDTPYCCTVTTRTHARTHARTQRVGIVHTVHYSLTSKRFTSPNNATFVSCCPPPTPPLSFLAIWDSGEVWSSLAIHRLATCALIHKHVHTYVW